MCLMAACSGRSASVRGGAGVRVGKNLCCEIHLNRRPVRGSAACTACSIVASIETRSKKKQGLYRDRTSDHSKIEKLHTAIVVGIGANPLTLCH